MKTEEMILVGIALALIWFLHKNHAGTALLYGTQAGSSQTSMLAAQTAGF